MYTSLIRPILFLFKPETAHNIAAFFLSIIGNTPLKHILAFLYAPEKDNSVKIMGLEFPSRIGMAAGFDKNATMYEGLAVFGFGFVEVGTVTPKAQPGNDKPRLFRLKSDKALINRMGFNNYGVDAMVERLKKRKTRIIIGGNIGKNKVTPNEVATSDYIACFNALSAHVDYFVVNVSSPNTPGLRDLQEKEPLTKLLRTLQDLNTGENVNKPILLKIAPDLTDNQLDDIIDIIRETGIEGVIATNTTIERKNLKADKASVESIGPGGLSGMPLKQRSLEVVRYLARKSDKSFTIIGVGGIYSSSDAKDFLEAGADLVQVYSGFIYEGPSLIKSINKALK